ncbi:hypothetical protein BV898_17871 [Hypsibius exemplaris]|uniref:Uncharacterized protein n=1 Tax=Hypsibius exemplaris TaxID=2072580 RepID=A0A9X6NIB6_HYPEX|nr:hypothetical protein BV898_17871 [Hypsibius exemplaris]
MKAIRFGFALSVCNSDSEDGTRTYQAAGQPSKVELVITVQDNSVLNNVYSQVPVIQEDIKEFRQVAGGLSTEGYFSKLA